MKVIKHILKKKNSLWSYKLSSLELFTCSTYNLCTNSPMPFWKYSYCLEHTCICYSSTPGNQIKAVLWSNVYFHIYIVYISIYKLSLNFKVAFTLKTFMIKQYKMNELDKFCLAIQRLLNNVILVVFIFYDLIHKLNSLQGLIFWDNCVDLFILIRMLTCSIWNNPYWNLAFIYNSDSL